MEHNKAEELVLQEVVDESNTAKLMELAELRLALSASGGGEVVFA